MTDIVELLRDNQPADRQAEREARIVLYSILLAAADEIESLRRGWLKSIQVENGCGATGKACREKCGCILEMKELMAND